MNAQVPSLPHMIVGLGNPGRRYQHDRHNVGFMVLNKLVENVGERFQKVQFDALLSDFHFNGKKIFLAKPQTYMNNSGASVAILKRYYRIEDSHLLVIFDDLDLPLGQLRVRPHGGSGGHKGMKSIINKIGTQEFPRIRFGIGRPAGSMDPSDYVLQSFSKDEFPTVERQIVRAVECIETILTAGIREAMNRFNVRNGV